MRLSSISVGNFKSFLEPNTVDIGVGFNLFIGANNSGKTTMLEALDLEVEKQAPHRSTWSLPTYGAQALGRSSLSVSIRTSLDELAAQFGSVLHIPLSVDYPNHFPKTTNIAVASYEKICAAPEIALYLESGGGQRWLSVETALGRSEKHQLTSNTPIQALQLNYKNGADARPDCNIGAVTGLNNSLNYGNAFKKYLYRFSPHRRPASESAHTGIPAVLDSEATNLAFCISQLQLNDAHGHSLFCEWVNRVFPSVHWVQAPSTADNKFQLRCLPRAPMERRDDLAVPISQMGTGIGHVLAILYIVLTSRQPRVIAIDEPNSFLHPKALRQLLQILSIEGAQHQYILTAHSADVLTAVPPSLVTMFDASDGRTKTRQVKAEDIADLRGDLSDLGIRMTDLHGRDLVLWVEGQTEELILPSLLRQFCPEIAAGTAVLRVEHTGKFDKKGIDIKEVANSYERLTSCALVPPMIAILLDREKRSKEQCEQLKRDTNGRLQFLDEAMIENYLLHASAIAAVLESYGENDLEAKIHEELERLLGEGSSVDGTKILREIFSSMSNTRVEFVKTRDVPKIVAWLAKNQPDQLSSLRNFLRIMFKLDQNVAIRRP